MIAYNVTYYPNSGGCLILKHRGCHHAEVTVVIEAENRKEVIRISAARYSGTSDGCLIEEAQR